MSVLRIICLSFRNNYRLPDPETIYIKKVFLSCQGRSPGSARGRRGQGTCGLKLRLRCPWEGLGEAGFAGVESASLNIVGAPGQRLSPVVGYLAVGPGMGRESVAGEGATHEGGGWAWAPVWLAMFTSCRT